MSDTRDFLKLFLWQAERTRLHSRDDPREDVGVGVRVGFVECQLKAAGYIGQQVTTFLQRR